MWCWRKMLRIPWTARKTNASVLQEVNPKMRPLEKTNYMALSYFSHIARRENNCLEKVLLQGKIEGSRRPGRPKAKWTDRIKSLVGKPLSTVYQLATDRNKWSSLMKVTNCQSRQIRSKQARYTTLWQPRPHGDSRPPSCAHSHPGIGHLHVPIWDTYAPFKLGLHN